MDVVAVRACRFFESGDRLGGGADDPREQLVAVADAEEGGVGFLDGDRPWLLG
jgi:hypothetical protein